MPGPITHLKVAYLYNKVKGGVFEPQLYLGSICPDSVNINGHAPKDIRWPAHLRDTDLQKWFLKVKKFYNDNLYKYDRSYLTGYTLHLVTDIAWDMWFDLPLFGAMQQSGIKDEHLKETRWLEIYGYEQKLIKESWCHDVISALMTVKPINIGTVQAMQTDVLRNRIVNFQLEKGREPIFLNDGFMTSFFNKTIELFDKISDL